MGSGLRRRCLGVPAGPRVRRRALQLAPPGAADRTLALVIGLPIVLVLAWYHGDRGQQRITTPEFAILTLLLLLGGGAFWYYQRASETRDRRLRHHPAQPNRPLSRPTEVDRRPAFVNMSGEGPGVLGGWDHRGVAEFAGEDARAEGHRAHLIVRV